MTAALPWLACMALSASLNNLPPHVLPAIHAVEGGRTGAVHRNANGTDDYGVMQINSAWLPTLAQGWGSPQAEIRDRLIADPCFNIVIAGAILRQYIDEEHGDVGRGIGDYHSHTPWLNQIYQLRVGIAALRQSIRGLPGEPP